MSPTTSTTKVLACVLLASSLQGLVSAFPAEDTIRSYLPGAINFNQHEGHLSTDDHDGPEWTYRRTNNDEQEPYSPSDWHFGYPNCSGDSQSPINLSADIEETVEASEFSLEFYGTECTTDELVFGANGDHWLVEYGSCADPPYLKFKGDEYELLQLHLHSPSEHMVGGSCHDSEIHLVHTPISATEEASDLLVVGIFLDASDYGSNVELEPLWDVLKTGATNTTDVISTKAYDLLPADPTYSHYSGSLTTPPCTEGVNWIVMSSPTVIGKMQLDECRTSIAVFEDSKVGELSNTNRPCQSVNDRTVYIAT